MTLLQRAGAQLRARLIPDVQRAWRFASLRAAAAGVVFEVLLSSGLLDQFISDRWKNTIHFILWGVVIVGRLTAQSK